MFFHKALTTITTTLLLTVSTLSSADDTDIFLTSATYDSSTVKPNVLFILDNSGSMAWSLHDNETAGRNEDSRMDVMQDAFADIMGSAGNINAGLMKLWSRSGESSRLTFPVTDIDALYGINTVQTGIPEILDFADDAVEDLTTGVVTTNSTTLVLGEQNTLSEALADTYEIQNSTDNLEAEATGEPWDDSRLNFEEDNIVALYFRDLNIPSTAVINEAYVDFTRTRWGNNDDGTEITINAELTRSPRPLADRDNFGAITKTSDTVYWNHVWSKGSNTTPNLNNVIQSIFNQTAASGNAPLENLALFFQTENGTARAFKRQDGGTNASNAPELYLSYSVPADTAQQLTGLRFQNVGIPQGSSINSARIEFVAADTDTSTMTLSISAGKPTRTNNNLFAETNHNLSSREKFSPISWVPTSWTAGLRYSADVKGLLQQVVNHNDWCGNDSSTFYFNTSSGTGKRETHTMDGNSTSRPRLVVEYTPSETGCKSSIITTRSKGFDHDGYESTYKGNMYLDKSAIKLTGDNNGNTSNLGGLHYPDLPLAKNATILEAYLEFSAEEHGDGNNLSLNIYVENSDSALPIASNKRNLSSRTLISTPMTWTINEEWIDGRTYRSPNIKDLITAVTTKDNWTPGNNINFILKMTGGERSITSFDRNPTYSPRLILKVADGGIDTTNGYKVKDHLVTLVNKMYPDNGTPIVPTMYDAATYFTDSFDGHSTPINHMCQSNHIVLLTDGEANSNTSSAKNGIKTLTGNSLCQYDANSDGEACGRTLSQWLYDSDLRDGVDGKNNIITHTIAFATQNDPDIDDFMGDLASGDEGQFYQAANAKELAKAFNDAFDSILENESTFAAPGVAANSFNRSEHLNQVYYSIFKPSANNRWEGNLKKYQLLGNPELTIHDASSPPIEAVDEETGFFKEKALSFWSKSVDGSNVKQGGVNHMLKSLENDGVERKVYTYLGTNPGGSGVLMTGESHQLKNDNTAITNDHFGLSSNENSRRTELINWIRGYSKGIGDPLHSTPALVTYKCNDDYQANNPFTCTKEGQELTLFLGTNHGLFQAFNAQNGKEIFAYMPQELLGKTKAWEANGETNRLPGHGRPYGLDGHIVIWSNDKNNNGVIFGGADTLDANNNGNYTEELSRSEPNANEFVYAYVGMRRGGRNYYALDVTNINQPEMLWFINGGTAPFQQLGQSWSRPVRTKIKIGATVKDVLIFSGGYDTRQDGKEIYDQDKQGTALPDEMGNAIYIVDAKTGSLIWSASGPNTGTHNLTLNSMKYSIPGGVTVADLQGDGLADQIFFGDTGGQVWRLFINNCQADDSGSISHCAVQSDDDIADLVWAADSQGISDSENLATSDADDGVIAYLGYAANGSDLEKKQNARRFYTRPDISMIAMNGKQHLAVSIGSGNRPDPVGRISPHIEDRFYLLTLADLRNPDVTATNKSSKNVSPHKKVLDVANGTLANLTPDSNNHISNDELDKFGSPNNQGWFLNMRNGEKVMSDPAIFNSNIFFNTYMPVATSMNSCSAVAGEAWSWEVKLNGSVVIKDKINSNGIVGNSVFIRTEKLVYDDEGNEEKKGKVTTVCRGTDCTEIDTTNVQGSTYWIQKK